MNLIGNAFTRAQRAESPLQVLPALTGQTSQRATVGFVEVRGELCRRGGGVLLAWQTFSRTGNSHLPPLRRACIVTLLSLGLGEKPFDDLCDVFTRHRGWEEKRVGDALAATTNHLTDGQGSSAFSSRRGSQRADRESER